MSFAINCHQKPDIYKGIFFNLSWFLIRNYFGNLNKRPLPEAGEYMAEKDQQCGLNKEAGLCLSESVSVLRFGAGVGWTRDLHKQAQRK